MGSAMFSEEQINVVLPFVIDFLAKYFKEVLEKSCSSYHLIIDFIYNCNLPERYAYFS